MKKLQFLFSKNSYNLCLYLMAILFIPCTLFLSLFYYSMKNNFNTSIRQSDLNLVEQLNMNIEYEIAPIYSDLLSFSITESLQTLLREKALTSKGSDLYLTFNQLDNLFTTGFKNLDFFHGIVIEPLNGGTLYFNQNNNFILNNPSWQSWRKDTLALKGKVNWIGSYNYADQIPLFILSKVVVDNLTQEHLGVIYLALYDYSLFSNLQLLENPNATIYILDEDNHIIFRNNTHILPSITELSISSHTNYNSSGITEITYDNLHYTLIYSQLNSYNLRVVQVYPSTIYTRQLNTMTFIFLIILFIIFLSFIVYIIYFYKRLLYPLNRLATFFTYNHSNPSFLYDLNTFKSYEFRCIGNGILSLVQEKDLGKTKIDDLCRDKDLILLEKLQSQINPHFLYNTLTSVKYMALNGEVKQISPIITSLIKLLRSCTNREGDFITVSEEIDHLKHYTVIQEIIYKNNISFTFDITPCTTTLLTPNFILQPLVENAIFHGIDPISNSGAILIKAYLLHSNLIFEIVDNGKGFDPSTYESLKASKTTATQFSGIGMTGTAKKIKLLCGNDYGLQVFSTPNIGTTIQVLLPIIESNEVDNHD